VVDGWSPGFDTTKVSVAVVATTTVPKSADDPVAARRRSAAGASPLPISDDDAEPPGFALTVKVAALEPVLAGLNAMLTAHVAPAASIPVQVFEITVNSAALVPSTRVANAVVVPAMTPPRLVIVKV
jgi:hypothetical protein